MKALGRAVQWILLGFFGDLTLGAGMCGAVGVVDVIAQTGPYNFGKEMIVVGLFVGSVAGVITRGIWLSISCAKPPVEPDRNE